jgi:two-component system, NtrC family, nitrogen regulation response regulator NtrX
MSLSAQAKVLRALQENRITRVGGEKDIAVDVRVVAATNKNLRDEILKGNFREDLYHRLSVILIQVPPLKDRKDDIPLLAVYFMEEACNNMGRPVLAFSEEAFAAMKNLEWTGNIRELRNVVERLAILCDQEITDRDIERYAMPIQ